MIKNHEFVSNIEKKLKKMINITKTFFQKKKKNFIKN